MTDTRVSRRWIVSLSTLMLSTSSQRMVCTGVDAWVVPPFSGWTKLPIQSIPDPQFMADIRYPERYIHRGMILYGNQGPSGSPSPPLSTSTNETSPSEQSKNVDILDMAVVTLNTGANAMEKASAWVASCIEYPFVSRFSYEHMGPFETPEYKNMSPLQQVIFSHRLSIQVEQNWITIYTICAAFLFSFSAFNAYLSEMKNSPPPGFPVGDQVLYDEGFGWILDNPFLFTILRTRTAGYTFGICGLAAILAAEYGMTRRDEETNKLIQQLRWMKYRKEQKVQAESARNPNYDPGPSELLHMDPEEVLREIRGDERDFISTTLQAVENTFGVGSGKATLIGTWASNTTDWIVGIGSQLIPGWMSPRKPSGESDKTTATS
eukprot:Nitzschia sp. Nitz4//scaffold98_size77359//12404//13537//NITZ4_005537-RA/size77359-processed-gene-0.117-mRNA-1//1//CDS//3329560724//7322//frame0